MFDARLIGIWAAGNSTVDITADGLYFLFDGPSPYTLSPDGMVLTFPNTNPLWQSNRLSGDPTSIVGLWERFEPSPQGTWREEWNFRADGSYAFHWSLDGNFDSQGTGTYTATATDLTTRELRATLSTGPGDEMVFVPSFSAVERGTYSVAADGLSWTYNSPNGAVTFTKVT